MVRFDAISLGHTLPSSAKKSMQTLFHIRGAWAVVWQCSVKIFISQMGEIARLWHFFFFFFLGGGGGVYCCKVTFGYPLHTPTLFTTLFESMWLGKFSLQKSQQDPDNWLMLLLLQYEVVLDSSSLHVASFTADCTTWCIEARRCRILLTKVQVCECWRHTESGGLGHVLPELCQSSLNASWNLQNEHYRGLKKVYSISRTNLSLHYMLSSPHASMEMVTKSETVSCSDAILVATLANVLHLRIVTVMFNTNVASVSRVGSHMWKLLVEVGSWVGEQKLSRQKLRFSDKLTKQHSDEQMIKPKYS